MNQQRLTPLRSSCALVLALFGALGLIGLASWAPVAAQAADEIVDELERSGRYLEPPTNSALTAIIDEANAQGIAFAWLNDESDAEAAADQLIVALADRGSSYRTLAVLTLDGVGATSFVYTDTEVNSAFDRGAFEQFRNGAVAAGLESLTRNLVGGVAASADPPDSNESSGFGFGQLLLVGGAGIGGFWLFRNWRRSRSDKEAARVEMEADRAEIKEQLLENADRVISLGDQVIDSGDHESIALYEKASRSYRDVSTSVDSASTAEEVDALDDVIDKAEWQFEVIEARLEGRTPPPSPEEIEAAAEAARREASEASTSADPSGPVLGQDESVFNQDRGRPAPGRTSRQPRRRSTRSGGLGGMLGGIVLGQMGGMSQSRRSQQRSGRRSGGGYRRGGGNGGLGGGVLRPSSSRRRPSGGGGGSFGKRKPSGGGGRF